MNRIKLFLENKGHENPRACVRIHVYAHVCFRPAYTCFMLAYAYTGMHMHVRVPETLKGKFFALKLRFGINPTSSRSHCNTPNPYQGFRCTTCLINNQQ